MTSKPISKEWMQLCCWGQTCLNFGLWTLDFGRGQTQSQWPQLLKYACAALFRLYCFGLDSCEQWAHNQHCWRSDFHVLRNYTWSKVKASKSTLRACPSWLMMRLLLMTAVSTLIHVRIKWALLICVPPRTHQSKNCVRYYENIYCFYFLRARAGSRCGFSRPLPLLSCCSDHRRN